jgi:hypothetical protein
MKFSSRTDVILPGYAETLVRVGDRVKGGSGVLARIPSIDPLETPAEINAEILV